MQGIIHHFDNDFAGFVNLGVFSSDNLNCFNSDGFTAGFDNAACTSCLRKGFVSDQTRSLMIKAKTVAAKSLCDCAIIIIGFDCSFGAGFGLFDCLHQFPIGNGAAFHIIQTSFGLCALRIDPNRKEHVVTTFLDDACFILGACPNQIKDGAILNKVGTFANYRIAINVETITADIIDFGKRAANLGHSFGQSCSRSKRIFKFIDLVIKNAD